MSDNSQQTPTPASTESTAPDGTVISEKPNESVSLLNEQPKETSSTPSKETETPKEPTKEGDKPKDEKPTGAPEKYEAFKMPEGFQANEEVLDQAREVFKAQNLSQEQAQGLVDFYVKVTKDAAEAPFNLWRETQKNWVAEIKADPEIGGKLDAVRATIGKMLDTFEPKLTASFREAMDFTGAGNNPAFVRFMWQVAQRLTESKPVVGNPPGGSGKPTTAAEAMYPHLAKG